MCVDVSGDLGTGVAEQLRDGPQVNSVFEHRRGGGVTKCVDRRSGDPGAFGGEGEGAQGGAGVDRVDPSPT